MNTRLSVEERRTFRQIIRLERRRTHQQAKLAEAKDPTARFDIVADWLMVEARTAGRLPEVTGRLLEMVDEIRAGARFGGGRRAG